VADHTLGVGIGRNREPERTAEERDRAVSAADIIDLIGLIRGLAGRIDVALNPNHVQGDAENLPF
jgi:hypothetical protein